MTLLSPFAKDDDLQRLEIVLDQTNRRVLLRNAPKRTRVLFSEVRQYPRFFTVEQNASGATLACNAANRCLTYAISHVSHTGGYYDCDLLFAIDDEAVVAEVGF